MATEFPVDPEFGRFVDPMTQEPEEDEGVEVELDLEEAEMEELPDGSVILEMDSAGPMESEDFYQNLSESGDIDDLELSTIAMRYLDLIDRDKKNREKRDEQYEEGIRRTGMGNDAPGGAQFQGASKVVHPIMAEACVDFASRAIKEMFPPDGPTRTKIIGEINKEKVEIAERKRDFMNWQLTEQIEEFRDEQEQLMTQLPLGGSQYLKLWYDEKKRRPCAEFVPIDNILLPFSAANFYTAQRVTEIQDITQFEFDSRIRSGLYKDITYIKATEAPTETKPEKANNKVEGISPGENDDGVRRVYHIYTYLSLEDDKYSKGEPAPYVLMIDEFDNEVVGLYRNWEEADDTMAKLDWVVEFKFIPWRGAYAIGLPHLIGGLAAALTGALRALLDTAHVNNSLTAIRLKGSKVSGQSQNVEITQVTEIEAAPGVDDIRKIAMPLPFNPPSPVLFELLGWLNSAAKGVVTTAEEKIADINANTPVGTTQALIEQGAAVFSSIHARLHDSQGRVLKILSRINRWYLDDMRRGEIVEDLDIKREDFSRVTDVIPVSDPHIFSETQRMAQTQAVMAIMDKNPDLFNRKVVIERFLKQIKVPGVNELMIDMPAPMKIDAANENVAMTIGQSAFAYPEQDHLAHIQTHLDFAKDPSLGSNPLIAPTFVPKVMEHTKQHIALWYLSRMNGYVEKSLGEKMDDYELLGNPKGVDKLFAVASQHVGMDSEQTLKGILPVIQQMQQLAQQYKPQPPMDAGAKVLLDTSMAETQRRAKRDEAELSLQAKKDASQAEERMQKLQQEYELSMEEQRLRLAIAIGDIETRERIEAARIARDAAKLSHEQDKTVISLIPKGGNRGNE